MIKKGQLYARRSQDIVLVITTITVEEQREIKDINYQRQRVPEKMII